MSNKERDVPAFEEPNDEQQIPIEPPLDPVLPPKEHQEWLKDLILNQQTDDETGEQQ